MPFPFPIDPRAPSPEMRAALDQWHADQVEACMPDLTLVTLDQARALADAVENGWPLS